MQFNIPTTKDGLYETLREIYAYYRLKKEPYEEVELVPLELERDAYVRLNVDEIQDKATQIIDASFQEEKEKNLRALEQEKSALEIQLENLSITYDKLIEEVNEEYDSALLVVQMEAKKNGLINSTVTTERFNELSVIKANKITQLNEEKTLKISNLSSQIQALSDKITEMQSFFNTLFTKKIDQKIIELEEKQDEIERDVFRYNNSLEEKEQKSFNNIVNTKASLRLKYDEINAHVLTKEELVELGYYADVIDCVCGYYDSSFTDSVLLYKDFLNEAKLTMYLEEFYADVLYMYRMRAGL